MAPFLSTSSISFDVKTFTSYIRPVLVGFSGVFINVSILFSLDVDYSKTHLCRLILGSVHYINKHVSFTIFFFYIKYILLVSRSIAEIISIIVLCCVEHKFSIILYSSNRVIHLHSSPIKINKLRYKTR